MSDRTTIIQPNRRTLVITRRGQQGPAATVAPATTADLFCSDGTVHHLEVVKNDDGRYQLDLVSGTSGATNFASIPCADGTLWRVVVIKNSDERYQFDLEQVS